jgi:diguanylate cyclase (GGDEF)-like protein
MVDSVTELSTLRGAQDQISEAMRRNAPLSCILLDIDRFQAFNFAHGYMIGDRLLCEIANLLKRFADPHGIAMRLGPDEFLLVLPDADEERAQAIAAQLISRVEAFQVEDIPRAEVTAGIVSTPPRRPNLDSHADGSFNDLLSEADRRLYEAKVEGHRR